MELLAILIYDFNSPVINWKHYDFKNLSQEGFEASTTSWSVLHMYILDENLDYAVGGYVNYGQER